MKLYAKFVSLWFALIVALAVYVGLYKAVAEASAAAFAPDTVAVPASETRSDDAKLKNYIVSPSALPSFARDLIARAEGVGVSASVTGAPVTDERFFRSVLSTHGSFDAVMRSIGVIEYAPYILSIDRLSVGAGENGSWHSELMFSVGLDTAL